MTEEYSKKIEKYVIDQKNRLLFLEIHFPHDLIKKQLAKQLKNLDFGCPASKLEIPREEVNHWAQKTMAFSNLVWGLSRLFDYNEEAFNKIIKDTVSVLSNPDIAGMDRYGTIIVRS